MKALIVFFSQSGTSAAFARIIAEKLRAENVDCDLELLKPIGKYRVHTKSLTFRNAPVDFAAYDLIIVGGPVWAFTANPPLSCWLSGIDVSLAAKKCALFVTQGFPFKILGGNQAATVIGTKLRALGADIVASEVVPCPFIIPRRAMAEAALRIRTRLIGR